MAKLNQSLGNKEIMAQNISFYMHQRGISRNKLSADLNVSYTTLTDWIKGKTYPRIDKIELLARYFGVNKSDLVEEHVSDSNLNRISTIYQVLDKYRQESVYRYAEHLLQEQQNEKIIQADFSGEEIDISGKVAAGLGTRNFDKRQPLFTVRMNKEDVPDHYDLALQVTGNSMEPTFQDGEIIFIQEQNEFQNGMIAAVEINEEAFIKKIYKEESRIRLVSLNRDTDENGNRLYPDFYADEKDELYLIGKVIL